MVRTPIVCWYTADELRKKDEALIEEPKIEKKMTWEDYRKLAAIGITAVFVLLLLGSAIKVGFGYGGRSMRKLIRIIAVILLIVGIGFFLSYCPEGCL